MKKLLILLLCLPSCSLHIQPPGCQVDGIRGVEAHGGICLWSDHYPPEDLVWFVDKTSKMMGGNYDGMGVILVGDWPELTEEFEAHTGIEIDGCVAGWTEGDVIKTTPLALTHELAHRDVLNRTNQILTASSQEDLENHHTPEMGWYPEDDERIRWVDLHVAKPWHNSECEVDAASD